MASMHAVLPVRVHPIDERWPRGLSREEAARYIGIGPTKFDEMVADGRMPKPKRVDGRVIWDRVKLDAYFTDLPEDRATNPWDRILLTNRQVT